jgi:hypothetical protein
VNAPHRPDSIGAGALGKIGILRDNWATDYFG